MENRLKERLTGAAILVALIVLIVPEMFHGPASTGAKRAPAAGEGPPVRSYTIDLNDNGTQATPLRLSGPPAAPEGRPTGVVPSPSVAPAAPVHGGAVTGAGAGSRAAAVSGAAAPAATRVKKAGGVVRPAAAGWSVQLGLFSKADNATRLEHAAHNKGFPVHVTRSTHGLYRVALEGLNGRAAALQASRRLHAAGLPAAIVGPR